MQARVAARTARVRDVHAAHRRTAIETYEQSKTPAGDGAAHSRPRSIHRHTCSGDVTLVSADRQTMSKAHDPREIPGTMCANFERRTTATSAPSMNTSMKLQGPYLRKEAKHRILTEGAPLAPQRNQYVQQRQDLQQRSDDRGEEHQRGQRPVALGVQAQRGAHQGRRARTAVDVHGNQRIGVAEHQKHQGAERQRNCGIDGCAFRAFATAHRTARTGVRPFAGACARRCAKSQAGQTMIGGMQVVQGGRAPVSISRRVNR